MQSTSGTHLPHHTRRAAPPCGDEIQAVFVSILGIDTSTCIHVHVYMMWKYAEVTVHLNMGVVSSYNHSITSDQGINRVLSKFYRDDHRYQTPNHPDTETPGMPNGLITTELHTYLSPLSSARYSTPIFPSIRYTCIYTCFASYVKRIECLCRRG